MTQQENFTQEMVNLLKKIPDLLEDTEVIGLLQNISKDLENIANDTDKMKNTLGMIEYNMRKK